LQAAEFIMRRLSATHKRVQVASFVDGSFLKALESALRFGTALIVQDIEANMDPIINPVLNREFVKVWLHCCRHHDSATRCGLHLFALRRTCLTPPCHRTRWPMVLWMMMRVFVSHGPRASVDEQAGGRVLVRLGELEVDFSPTFTMVMTTRDNTHQFPPDLCSRVTFVNFVVTPSSLQSQCLNKVLRVCRPDVDAKRTRLLKLQGEFQVGCIAVCELVTRR
jgi:hypothetical protein